MSSLDGIRQGLQKWDSQRENSSRLAFAFGTFTTEGSGSALFPDPVEFGTVFVRRPYVSYSWALAEQVDDLAVMPNCSGGVYRWKQDENGFYVGAWCGANVSIFSTTTVTMYHDFTFANMALKDIPIEDLI
jgi:hypothetical protein